MRSYIWDDKYNVGFKPIDSQHKSILRLINRIMLNREREKKLLVSLIDELICYIQYHFKSEENYMLLFEYKEYASHLIEHAIFIKDLIEITDLFKDDGIDIESLLESLVGWWNPHIIEVDKIIGRFLANVTSE